MQHYLTPDVAVDFLKTECYCKLYPDESDIVLQRNRIKLIEYDKIGNGDFLLRWIRNDERQGANDNFKFRLIFST